jgi:hypothetical protein
MTDLAPSPDAATALDPERLHDACRAIGLHLVRSGLRPHGPPLLPEQEATISALAIMVEGASDSEDVILRFLDLVIPVLARSLGEIEVLHLFAVSEQGQALVRSLFAPLAPAMRDATTVGSEESGVASSGPTISRDALPAEASRAAAPAAILQSAEQRIISYALVRFLSGLIESGQRLLALLRDSTMQFVSRGNARRARLVRKSLANLGPRFSLVLSAANASGATAARQRRTAITLTSWEDAGKDRLDLPRTVRSTIACGGLFRPVWRQWRRASEYLFLVQGLGMRDIEQARLQLLLEQLVDAGARISCYFYPTDPRQLRDFSAGGDGTFRTVDLATVADRHPYSRLIVISSGHELIHPFTGKPMDWASTLAAWPQRHVLTPLPETAWSSVERALSQELQFTVRPASRKSLIEIAAGIDVRIGVPRKPAGDRMAGLIGISDLRYLTSFAPRAEEQNQLIGRLHAFLGERGFQWLTLCACYPELDLALTQHLRTLLPASSTDEEADEELLARLTSLAWFRHGFLPTWLRRRIIAELPRAQRLAMRRAIATMLSAARFASKPQRHAGSIVLPVWEGRSGTTPGARFDGVTLDFLVDGPTRDIDPLVRVGAEVEVEADAPRQAPQRDGEKPVVAPARQRTAAPRAPVPAKPRQSEPALQEPLRPSPRPVPQATLRPTRRFRIFISSASDVPDERLHADLIVEKLSQDYSRFFTIESYRWEHEAMLASAHFQDPIESPADFDIVVLILWSRLGTPLPLRTAFREYRGIDGREPITGVEWEFEQALDAARKTGRPDIVAFRNISPGAISTRDIGLSERAVQNLDALDQFWGRHFTESGRFVAAHNVYRTLEEFTQRLEQSLRRIIERRIKDESAGEAHSEPIWFGDPFRGLEAYEFQHAPIFFGRDAAVAKATEQLASNARAGRAFLLVSGASGSGKSSLVKAGIVPRLMKPQRIMGAAFLRRVVFRPGSEGNDIFLSLAKALTRADAQDIGLPELIAPGQDASQLALHLRSAAGEPGDLFGRALGRLTEAERKSGRILVFEDAKLILVVDQLEELFAGPSIAHEDLRRFIQLLSGLAHSGSVWVIATLRADFWHWAADIPELIALAEGQGRIDLAAPSAAELTEIIRKSVRAAGLSFEARPDSDLGLDALLVADAAGSPGALPLLSFTLDELFRRAKERGETVLTHASYEALGGLEGAIGKRADETMAGLPAAAHTALPRVLLVLTTVSGSAEQTPVERAAPLDSFPQDSPERVLIDAFVAARLLVATGDSGARGTVRLAHDALISHWPRARVLLQENRYDLVRRDFLEQQYRRWQTSGRARERLLRGADLRDATELQKRWAPELGPGLTEYIRRSRWRLWPW